LEISVRAPKKKPIVTSVEIFDERVKPVVIKSRRLIVTGIGQAKMMDVVAAIVWVSPAKDTTAEQMAAAVSELQERGAARVLPLPLEVRDAAVSMKTIEEMAVEFKPCRDVVEELLSNLTELREEVSTVTRSAMDEVGL
jgi:hypothetical protein